MKTKHFLIFSFLVFSFAAFANNQTFAQTQKLTMANLKGSDYSGCGCSFQNLAEAKKPQSTKIIFWSEDGNTAILNVNGKDTEFKLVKEGKRPTNQKIGSRFSDEYAANGITVNIDYLITRVCLKGEEDCEATSYDATITATRGKIKSIVKTKGACGC
jgi:hypothetical protein